MSEHRITVRHATDADVPTMVELWKEYMEFHRKLDPLYAMTNDAPKKWCDYVAGHITCDLSCVVVAESGGAVVGFCLAEISHRPPVMRNQTYGAILDLAVTQHYRRKGIGKLLFEEAKHWFEKRKITRIELRVVTANPVSLAFWEQIGFRTYVEVQCLDL